MNNSVLRQRIKRVRFYLSVILSRIRLSRQVRAILKNAPRSKKVCSVCREPHARKSIFYPEGRRVEKNYCEICGHLFSFVTQGDFRKAEKLFNYHKNQKDTKYFSQRYLLERAVRYSNIPNGKFLDFGVGGNIGVLDELGNVYPNCRFFGCDIYPRKKPNHFETYRDESQLGTFDSISSNAVVEHLDNTLEAWCYFNRLLKPIEEGGGTMVHAFPSLVHFDLSHWSSQALSHACLFSTNSLQMICAASGFEVIQREYDLNATWPVFYFRKIRDLSKLDCDSVSYCQGEFSLES